MWLYLVLGLICISLLTDTIEPLFHVFTSHSHILFCELPVQVFLLLLEMGLSFYDWGLRSSWYILDPKDCIVFCEYFHLVWIWFTLFLNDVFLEIVFLNFDSLIQQISPLRLVQSHSWLRNLYFSRLQSYSPVVSYDSFIVTSFCVDL